MKLPPLNLYIVKTTTLYFFVRLVKPHGIHCILRTNSSVNITQFTKQNINAKIEVSVVIFLLIININFVFTYDLMFFFSLLHNILLIILS